MLHVNLPKIYNPANQSETELIQNFAVRNKLFREIYQDICHATMKYPEPHYIIQGIRGQGKTTLLLRIAYEIRKNKKLKGKIVPVIFNEEQYNISRLYKLWETAAAYLEEEEEMQGLHQAMQDLDMDEDYERRCFQLLESALKKQGKKCLLFIDNIDELFAKLSDKEHKRLREVFTESAELRLIGASSLLLEFHYDYGKPFYQFFKLVELKGLNNQETKTLLLKLGEKYKTERVKEIVTNEPGRIEALRRVTGGVIRTMVLLFEIFVDDFNGNAFADLEKILDLVTPLYKHRMDKLSPQQQEIIDVIALNWDAVGVKEIAQKIKLAGKAVSAQLNQLEKYHIIEKEKTDTKNHLYRIHERFFNIWYLMRCGRKWDEKRVRFLVEFLQSWCDQQELEKLAARHLSAIKKGTVYEQQALYLTEAIARTPIQRELQHELIHQTKLYLTSCHSELKDYLSSSDWELAISARSAFEQGKYKQASKLIEKIKNKTAEDWEIFAECNYYQGKQNRAKEYFIKAVENGNARAMNNLAILYHTEFKDIISAEKYFLMAIDKGYASAMYNLAFIYHKEFKDAYKAEKYYLMAIKKDDADAMYNLALLYEKELKDMKKAEKYYLMAIEKSHVDAMNGLAWLYQTEFNDIDKTEQYYLMAITNGHTKAMHNLAMLYFSLKIKKDDAIRFAKDSFIKEKTIYSSYTYVMVLLWNNEILKAYEISDEYLLKSEEFLTSNIGVRLFLMLLQAKKQYHLTLKLFQENPHHLKDRFKPVYYALMHFLRTEYPNEYRRMGSELKETVQEIIRKVDQMAKDYT
jgi:TPR repeat protein/nucleoside-triphosphatase THEP1/Fe2+ or Zn2+ uptake regulation protein